MLRKSGELPLKDVSAVLPTGVNLDDPSRYTIDTVRQILKHWEEQTSDRFLIWTKVIRNGTLTEDDLYPDNYGSKRSKKDKKGKGRMKDVKGKGKMKEVKQVSTL